MTGDDITCIAINFKIFQGKAISDKQKEIAIRFAFGSTAEDIAASFDVTTRTIWLHLEFVREAFGHVTLSGLRTIIFMKIICELSGILTEMKERGIK